MKHSIWTSLLFLHGYIADPALARRLAEELDKETSPLPQPPDSHGEAMRRVIAHGRRWSLRLCHGIGSGLVHMQ